MDEYKLLVIDQTRKGQTQYAVRCEKQLDKLAKKEIAGGLNDLSAEPIPLSHYFTSIIYFF